MQALLEMELAGLEPATSWVRSRRCELADVGYLQGLYAHPGEADRSRIAADIGRFPSVQALLATSA
jgi:hypothetical protein